MKTMWRRVMPWLGAAWLVGCGGGGGGPSESSDNPSSTDPRTVTMECEVRSYPCSFADVPLAVIERSLALSEEAATRMANGASVNDVASFLSEQVDVADVTADGPVLGFRLVGGRPMLVDVFGEQELLPAPSDATAAAAVPIPTTVSVAATPRGLAVRPRAVVSAGRSTKRALVLSPFRYEPNFGNAGEQVAAALHGIRGYNGNVTFLATDN